MAISSHDETSYARPLISEREVDATRPLKVIYIGAGISGILAAIHFLQAVPHLELVIYEKNPEIGGTWFENRYPGCACDIPSHAYQLSHESWTGWSNFYAASSEILEYWKMVATKHDVRKRIRFNSRCLEGRWNEKTSKWSVKLQDVENGDLIEDTADIFMTGTGTLNQWKWPEIKGLHDFQGPLLHSANWDDNIDLTDKHIAVIGAGSSGIQIVPALASRVKSMDHYVRGKTWIASQIAEDVVRARSGSGMLTSNFPYSEEEKATWRKDPEAYLQYRRALEYGLQNNYAITQKGSHASKNAQKKYTEHMKDRLRNKPEIFSHLIPNFPPLCKRLTPGPGYLEALASPKVNVIANRISHIDHTGIITADGVHRAVDAIVCATGFHTTPSAGFPVYGRDGVELRQKYRLRPKTYLGLCTDNFPNFFQSLGPNSFQGSGSLLIVMEYIHQYLAQILEHMVSGNIKTIEPKRKQVENFTTFCEQYFERTVYTAECSSWYKSSLEEEKDRGRVNALWPGSSLHALHVLKKVRWQDYDVETLDGNDFGWFGNGWTVAEKRDSPGVADLTWYLKDATQLEDEPRNPVETHLNGDGLTNGYHNGDEGMTDGIKSPDEVVHDALGLSKDIHIAQWTHTV